MAKASNFDVRKAILETAGAAVQRDGYNALSFRDVAAEIGVKSSSIHYHFPTKADLAEALVAKYCEGFAALMEPYADKPFEEALEGYLGLFRVAFDGTNRLCIGGMMAAEVSALNDPAREQLVRFAKGHIGWIKRLLAKKHQGMADDLLQARATAVFAALEGAMLMVRGQGGDGADFDRIVETYKASGLLG